MNNLTSGITVLICIHNGEKNLPATLLHLAEQNTDPDLKWEVLVINNASTDNTAKIAVQTWNTLKCCIPFRVIEEKRPGKDKAVDLGLSLAKFSYVIICDDDNWLNNNYVQLAFDIMQTNQEIGMLGGEGVPVSDSILPKWFDFCRTNYAVGAQHHISGEIKYYWPQISFIWGAGSVINMRAYHLLKKCGFERILQYETVGKVARSEDLELCYAIWLTGYKLWFDRRLKYQHHIASDRLNWSYLMNHAKTSILSNHYLKPYQILLAAGYNRAPKKSFWKHHLIKNCRIMYYNFTTISDIKLLVRILLTKHMEDREYLIKSIVWFEFLGVIKLWKKYDKIYKKVAALQKRISQDCNS